jgi:hypothetical protein
LRMSGFDTGNLDSRFNSRVETPYASAQRVIPVERRRALCAHLRSR